MRIEKIRILFIILLVLMGGSAFSQIKEKTYITRTFSATDSKTNFLKEEVKIKKDEIIVTSYKCGKKWKKIKSSEYVSINDSAYINKSIGFNRHTLHKINHVIHKIVIKKIESDLFYFKEYNYNKCLLREGSCKSYFPLIKHHKVMEYYLNGKLSSITEYDNNEFLTSQRWKKDGLESIDDVYMETELAPRFKNKSISTFYNNLIYSIRYPLNPGREKLVEGNCIIEFILDKHGVINEMQFIEESEFPAFDIQICDYIKKRKNGWSPAEISDKKVDYVIRIGVSFSER
ncbi:MAG: hypothetical protein JEZ01_11930 [Labilibaculum sp.]|nr:hypothetical protein [Labilibaculum sp.]MBI9058462.1 hypothetical protein [Labilibaculum sp.]